jgi:hypothetical protein
MKLIVVDRKTPCFPVRICQQQHAQNEWRKSQKSFFSFHFAAKSAKVFKQMRRAALPAKRGGGIIQMTHPRLFVKLDSSSWKRTSVRAKGLDDNDGV